MHTPTPASADLRRPFLALGTWARHLAVLTVVAGAVAGCGGSADAPPPPGSPVVVTPPPPPVQDGPLLVQQPASACVIAPAVATFSASASGDPAATVQWQRSTDSGVSWTPIAGATSTTYATSATAIGDDNARFRAVFTNTVGSATSLGATLNVMSPAASRLTVLAGNTGGPGDLNGCGAAARFNHPQGVAIDSAGNIYVADTGNQTIRKITPANGVATLAGRTGIVGAADGAGAAASFSDPVGIAVDASGNVFVADSSGPTIRKVTPAGVVSTFVGSAGSSGSANGQGAAASFSRPLGMTIDPAGNLYVVDQGSTAVRKVTPAGVVTTFASLTNTSGQSLIGFGIVMDTAGNVYVGGLRGPEVGDGDVFYDEAEVWRFKATGEFDRIFAGSAPGTSDGNGTAAAFDYPNGLGVDTAGNVYVADVCNDEVRMITPAGDVTTIAGNAALNNCGSGTAQSTDGVGAAAVFDGPAAVAVDAAGNLVVADSLGNVIRRVAADRTVTTIAGTASATGTTDGVGAAARFQAGNYGGYGGYTTIDAAGNVYLADTLNHTIRKITPDGTVSTFAGSPDAAVGIGYSGVNGQGSAAVFGLPEGITIDAAGNLYVVDFLVNEVRKITPDAVVSTVAQQVGAGLPWAVAIDAFGNLFVTDPFADAIEKITPAGVVSTFAGSTYQTGSADGKLSTARFDFPQGIVADATGNLYVADTNNDTIRKITPAGVVSTLSGVTGVVGSADGAGSAATFNAPTSVAVDAAGNVYVADTGNNTIRKIAPDGTTTTLIGSASQTGVRANSDPRLYQPFGISVRGQTLIVLSANAVLRYDLP